MRSTQDGDIYFCNAKPIINFRIIFFFGGGTIVFNGRASLNKSTLVPRNASSNAQSRLELWWHFFAIFRRIFWHFSYKELLRFWTKNAKRFAQTLAKTHRSSIAPFWWTCSPNRRLNDWQIEGKSYVCAGRKKEGLPHCHITIFLAGKKSMSAFSRLSEIATTEGEWKRESSSKS
jgi:hypothetical protein